MDAKGLLAEATAETLREDAAFVRLELALYDHPMYQTGHWRERVERLSRLAALAEAVAEAEDRSLDLRVHNQPLWGDDDLDWYVVEHYMESPHERTVSEYNGTLPAALSTLLPTPNED